MMFVRRDECAEYACNYSVVWSVCLVYFMVEKKDERERSMREQLRASIVKKNNCDREELCRG